MSEQQAGRPTGGQAEYRITNPATGEVVATYPSTTDAELEQALVAATSAHRDWSRTTSAAGRGALVRRVAELHRERREELADAIVTEMGKPRAAALGEVDFAADIYEYYADRAEDLTRDQPVDLLGGEGTAVVRRASLGPLLGIMPWNFPYYQVARFVGPNVVVGNTILLKHAPQCPRSAELIHRSSPTPRGNSALPRACTSTCASATTRRPPSSVTPRPRRLPHRSERAGAAVAEVAGRHLKKVALELGGSDPFVLLSTDDLDAVVEAAAAARLDNTGQSCNAAKRFIVVDDLYDAFVEKLAAAFGAQTSGDPTAEDTDLGPLSSLAAAERLAEQVDRAVAQGATVVTGATRDGAYYAPTVLTGVSPDNDAYHEELFGPVAVVHRVSGEDAAVELANDTPYGLGSYVWTTDAEQAQRVADRIEAGMVFVNCVLADSPELPFGGIKRSGTSRELGTLAAEEFVNKKLIRTAG